MSFDSTAVSAFPTWYEEFERFRAQRIPFVLVTQTGVRGHAPQEVGARAFVGEKGLLSGTVGGGKVEARAIEHATKLLADFATTGKAIEAVTWNLTRDIGMTCGGEASFLFEIYGRSDLTIRIFGAGHVAQAVVRACLPLSCQITVLDPRPEWLAKLPKDPKIEVIHSEDLPSEIHRFREDDYFLVLTKGHASDLPILISLFKKFPNPRYAGCMGSDVKALRLRRELKEAGISEKTIEGFRCPIGLALGRNDPAEIAISTLAQVLRVRDATHPASDKGRLHHQSEDDEDRHRP